jgi:iron complex outermembrane receptor protein
MMVRRLLGLILITGWAGLTLAAGTGRIQGRVVNEEQQGVGGVAVRVHQTGIVVFSDEDGRFVIEKLEGGNYTLLLSFGDEEVARLVSVAAGDTLELDVEVDWTAGGYERVKVTAAAAHAAKIVDAPAAITSVDEEQIEREAAHGQLPKILEFTPGAEVTQSGLYDFNFNTRGFNSSLNRRVSTYIDGRDVGVVLLGAQEWAAISVLDDLENLEFIRGPSAALYGANASSGVVNMTSKAPRDSRGGMFRATAGELETQSLDVRWADELAPGWYYKVLAGSRDTGDFSVSRNAPFITEPEYSEFCDQIGEINCLLPEKTLFREQDNEIRFASLRIDKYLSDDSYFTFEGGTTDIKGPVFQTGIGRVQIIEADRPWARFAYARPHWSVLAHWANRDGHQASLNKGLVFDFDLFSDTQRYGVEAQGNWNFGGDRGRFVIGAAHTEERVDSTDPRTGRQTIVYEKIDTNRQAIFTQVDWRVNDYIKLVFAGRADKNTLHDTQFSPKAAVVYNVSPSHTMRLTFNKAFQVANYSEFFLHTRLGQYNIAYKLACEFPTFPEPVDCGLEAFDPDPSTASYDAPILAVGNDDLTLEKTQAWEIGYSAILGKRAFLSVDYYNSDNEDFITDLVPQLDTSLGNPLNPDYREWESTQEAKDTIIPIFGLSVEQVVRNLVAGPVGSYDLPDSPFGFQLAKDLDADSQPCCPAVVIARTYGNVGLVETQGVDLGLQYFVTNAWNLQASYSWFDFEIIDRAEDLSGILVPSSPEHKASLSISFTKKHWQVSASGRWVHEFAWCAGVFCGPVPAYYTTDLTASHTFNDHVELGINVANVPDNIHRQTFGGDLLGRRALANLTFFW